MSEALLAVVQRLEQKAKEYGIPANSWDGYAVILRFIAGTLQRLPALNDLEACDIDAHFATELGHLAHLVIDLFPTDSFEELATFLIPVPSKENT